ncbi:hypothetical protein [Thermotoga profunda]|uniref:hypothetical protein n=1 Tax=Thermotoga profunda TaxID=1508420 RepID=UPI0005973D0B|nr:hypothetical protein [Thermotoga profunda]
MLSVAKQNRKINLVLSLCIILAVLNYTAGVVVYRNYIQKLSSTSVTCQILLENNSLLGEVNIRPPEDLTIYPVDYQIYFYDERGNTLQLIADSLNGQLRKTFDVAAREKLLSMQWHVVGYSNVKIKWLWLSMSLALPIEVRLK